MSVSDEVLRRIVDSSDMSYVADRRLTHAMATELLALQEIEKRLRVIAEELAKKDDDFLTPLGEHYAGIADEMAAVRTLPAPPEGTGR